MNSWWRRKSRARRYGDLAVPGRVAGAVGGDAVRRGRRARRGHAGEVGAVGAAAERDDDRAQRGERPAQARVLLEQLGFVEPASSRARPWWSLVVILFRPLPRPRRRAPSSSSSSSSSSEATSNSMGLRPMTSSVTPQLSHSRVSPLSTSYSSTSISNSHSGQMAIPPPQRAARGPSARSRPGAVPGGVRVTADTPTVVATGAWIIATSQSGLQRTVRRA